MTAATEEQLLRIEYPELWTTTEIAAVLKVTPRAIQEQCDRGIIRAIRVGNKWRIPQSEVDRIFAFDNTKGKQK